MRTLRRRIEKCKTTTTTMARLASAPRVPAILRKAAEGAGRDAADGEENWPARRRAGRTGAACMPARCEASARPRPQPASLHSPACQPHL
jgi:hypothetical protein